jgi:hypothetical protein
MKEIYNKKIESTEEISYSEDGVKIGNIEITHHHSQDCCESVYADWLVFKDYIKDIKKIKVENIRIKTVPDDGFVIFFEGSWLRWGEYYADKVGVFVPCYNSQNGYYSDNLELIIKDGEITQTIDITDCNTNQES